MIRDARLFPSDIFLNDFLFLSLFISNSVSFTSISALLQQNTLSAEIPKLAIIKQNEPF